MSTVDLKKLVESRAGTTSPEDTDLDDEDVGAEFIAQYNQDYGEASIAAESAEENVPPRVPLTGRKLKKMMGMLGGGGGESDEQEEEEEEDDGYEYEEDEDQSEQEMKGEDRPSDPGSTTAKTSKPRRKKKLVLGPDHPKMQRFQAALKRHLQKQLYAAKCKERQLEVDLKIKRKEREELGHQLYNLQFELTRQSDTVEKQDAEIQKATEEHVELEAETQRQKALNEQLRLEVQKKIQEEAELMKMGKKLDLLDYCTREAVKDYESQLKVNQRVDERFQKLKAKLEIEKKDQDIYLDRLMVRLQQMEQSNAGLQRQIQAHVEEQKELTGYINEATTEIEALQIEKQQLQRAWNETISVVRSRDEALAAARKTLEGTHEELKNKEGEAKQLMKAIAKEQENHEKITVRIKRKKMEDRQQRRRAALLEKQQLELKCNLAMLHQIKEKVEEDFAKSEGELSALEKSLDVPRSRIQKLLYEKKALEDEILTVIQEQTAMDKVSQRMTREIQQIREKTRDCEDEVAKIENDLTKMNYESEVLRTEILKKKTSLAELEKRLGVEEGLLNTQMVQMKYSERILQKKNSEIEHLRTKLLKLEQEQDDKGIGKLEEEVLNLEKEVAANRAVCVDLQESWLKLQDELVMLTARRDQMVNDNDIRRKEEFMLERKNQRIKSETAKKQEEVKKLQREIRNAQTEINTLSAKIFEGNKEHEAMEKNNLLLQNELVHILKDAELQAIELQEEIVKLESEKERIQAELAEIQEQSLLWEKKVQLAKELKISLKREQETTTTQLKLAIHHMEVRHNNLRRAQEKLMCDMERSIERRERIIEQAEFDAKRDNIHPNKILLNIRREEATVKERNKKLIQMANEAELEVKAAEEKVAQLQQKVKCETEALHSIKKIVDAADEKLGEIAIEKHKNLIEIILRQIKYKTLEAVSLNRFKPRMDPNLLQEEIKKTEDKCYSIVELCDALLGEFPQHQLSIKLVKASILPNVE